MKIHKILLSLLLIIASSTVVKSQTFEVPDNYELKTKEDYSAYEKDILNCINWLESTPFDQDKKKRKEASTFFMAWISGAPNVSITISSKAMNYADKNPDLLTIYLAGATKYCLTNPKSKQDTNAVNEAGINSLIEFYRKNKAKGLNKNKKVEKLIKS